MIFLHSFLLLVAPCIINAASYHGYRSEYAFDANLSHQPTWMKDIPDHVDITSLSIPGTHDTMTFNIGQKDLQCQNWNLTVQMEAGIRYVDIRARVKGDRLLIYHGNKYTGHTFKEVLEEMFAFLDKNPSEMFIMRLKKEGNPIGNDHFSFEKAFNYARFTDKATKNGAEKHIALYTDASKPIPTLGELRGKIFLLQDFKCAKNRVYGLMWNSPQMVLEDEFNIHGVRDLNEKWEDVSQALTKANKGPLDNKHIYLTHTSAAIGLLPIQAAAGILHKVQVGMDFRTGYWLDQHVDDKGSLRTGVLIFDFPGKNLIESVLAWNKHVVGKM